MTKDDEVARIVTIAMLDGYVMTRNGELCSAAGSETSEGPRQSAEPAVAAPTCLRGQGCALSIQTAFPPPSPQPVHTVLYARGRAGSPAKRIRHCPVSACPVVVSWPDYVSTNNP
jgi:hypothetical protein